MRQSITPVIFCLLSGVCWAQSFTSIQYSVPQGLPSNEVYEVYQDKKKFVWFATDNGVVRFDGHTMVKFNVEQGLTDPVVFGFYEDLLGRIWFRTFSGKLSYYDYTQGRIFPYAFNDKLTPLCQNSYIQSIFVDSLNQLWFGVNGVWGKIDTAGNITKNDADASCSLFYKSIEGGYVYGYCAQREINRPVLIDDKLLNYNPSYSDRGNPVLSALRWRGKFYFTSHLDLFEYDGTAVKKILTAKSGIISLSTDGEDNLWVGMYEGVERYSRTDFKNPLKLIEFDGTSVTEVIQDHERGIWITTVGKGVFYIPDFTIKNKLLAPDDQILTASFLNNHVQVCVKKGEMIVLSTKSHEVVDRKKFTLDLYGHYVDSEKNIWVTTEEGTYILDSLLHDRKDKKPIMRTMLTFIESSDGTVWTLDKSVVQSFDKDGNRKKVFRLDFYYRSMLIDNTNVYLTARTGMHVYDKEFNRIGDLKGLADYKFSKILDLNDSTLLLSSIGNGFFLLNKNTWNHTQYNARNKFVASDIYTAITADSTIWFGTEKGIIRTSINSLLKGTPTFQILTQKSGLVSDKVNQLLEVNDQIWAFYDHAYSAFPKNVTLRSAHKPVFYIHTITANDKSLTTKENVILEHTDNNLTINFGFIDFSNQNIFTRYRLTREDSWNYTTERSLKFYSLSPGIYEFAIEYSIDNTHWLKSGVSPRFTILPPWWQTWYFQTAVALLVLLMIFLYFRNRVSIFRRHQQKLIESEIEAIEHERSRIAKDLHDSVGTDFSAIKMVVSQLLKKHNEPKSEEIETQFQSTIHDIKVIIYGLSPPGLERYGLMAGVKNYVDKLNNTIPVKIEFYSFGPDVKDPRLNITVFRILQELISNSLKHSNADTIALHINSFDDLLNILYEDNGKGFSWENNQKGLGLYNIESRIQSINGQFGFETGSFGVSYTIDVPLAKIKN